MNFLKGDSKDESSHQDKSVPLRPNDKDLESGTSTLIEQPSTTVQECTDAREQERSKESELPVSSRVMPLSTPTRLDPYYIKFLIE
jgi:hypothetical protein